MSERTAAEILVAQLEQDVAEAKASVARTLASANTHDAVNSIENLIAKVVMRWWIARQAKRQTPPANSPQLQERLNHRAHALAACTQTIISKSGPIDNNALHMSVMSLMAENTALWGLLIDSGIVTPEARQDYMDAGVGDLYKRVHDYGQKIIVSSAANG